MVVDHPPGRAFRWSDLSKWGVQRGDRDLGEERCIESLVCLGRIELTSVEDPDQPPDVVLHREQLSLALAGLGIFGVQPVEELR